jgi:hypothetical protein
MGKKAAFLICLLVSLLLLGEFAWLWHGGILSGWFLLVPLCFYAISRVGLHYLFRSAGRRRYLERYFAPPPNNLKPGENFF